MTVLSVIFLLCYSNFLFPDNIFVISRKQILDLEETNCYLEKTHLLSHNNRTNFK